MIADVLANLDIEELERKRNQILAEMSILSDGSVSAYGKPGKKKGRRRKGQGSPGDGPTRRALDVGECKNCGGTGYIEGGTLLCDQCIGGTTIDSLYTYWHRKFDLEWPPVPEDADTEQLEWCYARAEKLVRQAHSDLRDRVGEVGPDGIRRPIKRNVGAITGSYERDKQIIHDYEGWRPEYAADYERCSAASIRTVRRQFQRCPECGRQTCGHGRRKNG